MPVMIFFMGTMYPFGGATYNGMQRVAQHVTDTCSDMLCAWAGWPRTWPGMWPDVDHLFVSGAGSNPLSWGLLRHARMVTSVRRCDVSSSRCH